jgi:hypothetical protein
MQDDNKVKALRPFFSYYGSKWRLGKYYPPPIFGSIIEPFAGSAGYSLRYHESRVTLYDVDPVIAGIWDYLIKVKVSEVISLPCWFDSVDDLSIPEEAKNLIGFWVNAAISSPRKTPSKWMKSNKEFALGGIYWGKEVIARIASQVDKIRHWKIFNESYKSIPNSLSTWFIDPPYSGKAGRHYVHNQCDYDHLSKWSKERNGRVIVCENSGAEWLDFKFLRKHVSAAFKDGEKMFSSEVIWTNELGTAVPDTEDYGSDDYAEDY